MKAFIPGAGYGKRMGDLTANLPKPLLPVNGHALLTYTLFQLYRWKCQEAVINLHYLPEHIVNYLKGFPHFPVHVSVEEKILGTAGGLRNALDFFRDEKAIIMINPDTLFFSHAWDRPEIPVKRFTEDTAACLFLREKPAESTERGWNSVAAAAGPACDAQDIMTIRHDENGGRFYYLGYSLVNPQSIRNLVLGEVEEFGPVWVDQAAAGNLLGKVYEGRTLDAGTREPYERLQGTVVLPEDLTEAWESFIAGWSS